MYNQFWGLSEKPFKLVPNPNFLFLSSTHEEALAHLNYILAEGEGFLMISGEVGTGKSTLCRAFLNDLDPTVISAYIFNPKLDALQLLKSINTEFGVPADATTAHELIENLNSFLINQKASEKKVIIVIDEAQNLPVESLEQLRLLSNLETTQQKLLQIVLVGQPELAKMIDSFELRQLGQRINLACRLNPLSYDETQQYIQHRLNVVSQKPQMPFSKGALRAIYTFSGGVPRLINTACDRMLLAAYLKKRPTISAGLATKIVNELTHRSHAAKFVFPWAKVGITGGVVFLLVVLAFLFLYKGHFPNLSSDRQPIDNSISESSAQPQVTPALAGNTIMQEQKGKPEDENETSAPEEMAESAESSTAEISLDDLIHAIRPFDTRRMAVEAVLQEWGLEPQGDMTLNGVEDLLYFKLIIERHGLSPQTIDSDIGALAVLDLPAIIRLISPEADEPIYVGVVGIHDGRYMLTARGLEGQARVAVEKLTGLWDHVIVIPWKNYLGYQGVIPGGAPKASVVMLKQLLWEIGYSHLLINDRYDTATRSAIMEIQAKHGLVVDGLVGNLTKIVLYNEKRNLPIPHLRR